MKIIEALKELKLIKSRMQKNIERISVYSSALDTEKYTFATEEEQRKEVQKLIQANNDLVERYLYLKAAIERTNLQTKVSMDGAKREYSIYELINIKRTLYDFMRNTYSYLTPKDAQNRLQKTQAALNNGTVPKVITFYNERERNEKLDELERFHSNISARLEVVNAVTDIIE